ncbi:uncharacterized protein G2W53_012333 [Senna tora]|uniref:Uncharacterized protein n=1 Tax=Senna tora TaxID=362788 RepID=A0A834WNG8_9FABA|nr:uncharacterized protein G2W53_012333 [Senna tora]
MVYAEHLAVAATAIGCEILWKSKAVEHPTL